MTKSFKEFLVIQESSIYGDGKPHPIKIKDFMSKFTGNGKMLWTSTAKHIKPNQYTHAVVTKAKNISDKTFIDQQRKLMKSMKKKAEQDDGFTQGMIGTVGKDLYYLGFGTIVKFVNDPSLKESVEELQEAFDKMPSPALLKKIAHMTDINDHTNSQIEIAKFMGEKKLQKELEAIEKRQGATGIKPADYKRRYEIMNELGDKMSPQVKKKFWSVT